MAKRDKLYTVNKWNKPFFEEEAKKKLYDDGGYTNGVNTDQAWKVFGYGDSSINPTLNLSSLVKQNNANPRSSSWSDYTGTYIDTLNPIQRLITTSTFQPQDAVSSKPVAAPESNQLSYNPNWLDSVTKLTTDASNIAKGITDSIKATKTLGSQANIISGMASTAPTFLQGVTPGVSNAIMKSNVEKMASDFGKTLNDYSTLRITDNSGLKHLSLNSDNVVKPGGISNLGKAGIGLAASIAGDLGNKFISDGFNTVPGTLISNIGSTAGTVLSLVPGVGWVVGPAVAFSSKILGGLYNRAFGSEYKDNGASAYTDWLNNQNINVSNEQGANLLSSIGEGSRATSRNGWLNHSAERRADATNTAQDLALERFRQGIRRSFIENSWRDAQLAALNNNITAMGGKLNRCKCNKKATGGILNNSYIDTSSPSGYDIMMTALGNQEQKNQMQQDTNSSLGNSFMGALDMGTVFADGGIMIKPGNRGKFTAKAKRRGMGVQQFANYVLAHKDKFPSSTVKQAVFAKNSHTWKKAFGGKLNYGNNEDIRDNSFFSGQTLYELGGTLQAAGSNWGRATVVEEGDTHENNPYQGVLLGVDPEGTPNLVEENEVIFNDYVFSNRIECPKEVCRALRVGVKKNGFTFAEVAKKLLNESKERPNDPISKKGLEANMQKLEDAQEEVKKKMEADEAVEQFNNLPPEQLVAIMLQEGEKAQNAVALEQMAQELLNMPPELQQAIAQQMAMEQALAQGMPQGPSPEELAMMQQLMAQQQMPQGINPQEALAQAAAMLQAGLNGAAFGGKLCFGGRRFAEGGELTEQPLAEPETAGQPIDSEMAKYSDEELQDMIEDYQEAESGEVKVTKGKLARLRKKAEKAQAELERRHSQEGEQQPQEERQEPSQEEIQAAALAQAMQAQQPIEGQPQGGIPQEGMSPEQAMMMQQQMGGQPLMSPEEMAAMELQQQQGGQLYACGGKLYPTGGKLSDYAQYFPNMSYDDLAKLIYDNNTDLWKAPFSNSTEYFGGNWKEGEIIPYDQWLAALKNANYNLHSYKDGFQWLLGTRDGNQKAEEQAILNALYAINPEARNSGWTFDNASNPYKVYDAVNFHDATSDVGNNGNKMVAESFYANDPAWNQLTEEQRQLKGNELAAALEGTQAYRDFSDYLRKNRKSQYVKDYFQELANRGSRIAKNALNKWDTLSSDDFSNVISNLREDAAAPPNSPGNKNNNALGLGHFTPAHLENWNDRYWVKDGDGNYSLMTSKPEDINKYIAINTDPYRVTVGNNNYNDYYYRLKTDAEQASDASGAADGSNYLTVGWKPKNDWRDYMYGALPGLTGLGMMLGRGAPDMSGLDAAVAAYERNTGTMVAPHLTHGLIRPAIIDPRVTENNLNARRLGTNRLLMNTGSTPSRGATILANDANTIGQLGQAMINNWRENRQQEQAAAAFNRETATTNANILNQVDQFNAKTKADMASTLAQLKYNAAKEKVDQRNAYYAGLLGNIGSIFTGLNEARKQQNNRNERNLLLASGVFGETNPFLESYYGISKVDPNTGKVVRGYNTGMYYWINPNTGKPEYLKTQPEQPSLAINSKGGKLKKNKKRKGFTF